MVLELDCCQSGDMQLSQGACDSGRTDGPATGLAQPSGELVNALGPVIAQGPQNASCRWSKRDGRVGQLGHGALVGAVQVVPGQHGSSAAGHAWPAVQAGTTTGAGEDQVLGVVTGWELAADCLDHQAQQPRPWSSTQTRKLTGIGPSPA